jgi:hypothetical protein
MTTVETRLGTTLDALADRLERLAAETSEQAWTDGRIWYERARTAAQKMAAESGYTFEQCVAVIAHLSPRVLWDRNLAMAWEMVRTGDTAGLGRNVAGARLALASADPLSTLHGPKVRAFAANIVGDDSAVTIDVWMLKAFGLVENILRRTGVYEALAGIIRTVAARLGTTAAALQAAIWIHVRGSAD